MTDRICNLFGYTREKYIKYNDKDIMFVDLNLNEFELMIVCLIFQHQFKDKYLVGVGKSGNFGIFPCFDEYWSGVFNSNLIKYGEVFDLSYYFGKKGLNSNYFNKFKQELFFPNIPSPRTDLLKDIDNRSVFVYTKKNFTKDSWLALFAKVKNLVSIQDDSCWDLDVKKVKNIKLLDQLSLLRKGTLLDIHSGTSNLAIIARSSFLRMNNNNLERTYQELCGSNLTKQNITCFSTILDTEQGITTIKERLESFMKEQKSINSSSERIQEVDFADFFRKKSKVIFR